MSNVQPTTRDWQLSDFNDPTPMPGGVELLLSLKGGTCLVVYPWHYNLLQVQPALDRAKQMGFTHISEYGNLYPYTTKGSDTDDSDFILLEAE